MKYKVTSDIVGTNNDSQPEKQRRDTNEALLTLLRDKCLKQTELAQKINVDKSYINRIIHNKEEAPILLKIKIAKVLGVDSRVIFPDE